MNALILDGRLKGQSKLDEVRNPLLDLLSARDWGVESITLHEASIYGCTGCFRCWHTTPGICSGVGADDASDIVKKIIACNLLVFLTPLTFGGYSSELKKIIERCLGLLQPAITLIDGESHHVKRYDRYPSVLSVAVADNPNKTDIELFEHLADRHSLNFYPPEHAAFVISNNTKDIQENLAVALTQVGVAS